MGQGLHTKVCQVAATVLGIATDSVFVSETSTDKVPNASPSAASASSDLYGMAVLLAAKELDERLQPVRAKLGADATFAADPTSAADPRIATDGILAAESNLYSLSNPCSRLVPCSGASLCEAFLFQSFAVEVLLRKCLCSGSRQCEVRLELLSLHAACISDSHIRLLWLLQRGRRSETGQLDQRPLQRVHLLQRIQALQQV